MIFQSTDSELIQFARDEASLGIRGTMSCWMDLRERYRGRFVDLSRLLEMATWCIENISGQWRFLADSATIRREGVHNIFIGFAEKTDQIKFQLTFTEDFRDLGAQ